MMVDKTEGLEVGTLEKDILEKDIPERLMEDAEDHITFIVPEERLVFLDKIENELNLTFEDNDFFVTVQELDFMDTLQDGDFSKSIPNDAKNVDASNSRLLEEVEIMLDPKEEIKSLEEEEIYFEEDIDIAEQNKMYSYDADISEEEEEKGVEKNDGVHYEHSCKRTYMFNPRCPHLLFTFASTGHTFPSFSTIQPHRPKASKKRWTW